ncbi:MAG: hypothetical protein ACLRIS_10485 [Flavonifractor plautii]
MGKKVYVDLTHPFSAEIPRWPYFDKPEITNAHTMAKGGVLTSRSPAPCTPAPTATPPSRHGVRV